MINPELHASIQRFRSNRIAWYSSLILTAMFLCSLPAELIFNDRPLAMQIDGAWYFPCVKSYSLADFGGDGEIKIEDYQSRELIDFLNGVIREQDLESVFGSSDEFDDEFSDEFSDELEAPPADDATAEAAPEAAKHSHRFIWPLYRHSYRSEMREPKSGRAKLAAPWPEYVEYEKRTYESSHRDGQLLGTDAQGKDVLSRIVYGFRIAMFFGLGLAITGTVLGCLIGGIQGYFGGWVDLLGQRVTEIWGSMPRLYLLIILSSFLARWQITDLQHLLVLFGILNLTAWMGTATYIRAEFLKARNLDYVRAAKALGQPDWRIMLRHILPNSLTPVVTFFPFEATGGILALTSLDFLQLGVRYPAPSLGELLSQGQENLHAIWIIVPTFLILTVALMLLTFVGDGIRNAFDPHHHG